MSIATAMREVDSIAIGGFDGMHFGHQHLFDELSEHGAILVIETGYANLTPKSEREKYTHYPIYYYQLDDIRHLDADGFMQKLKSEFPYLKKIVVGYDFHFGKDRRYSFGDLKTFFSGDVIVVDEVCLSNDSVHSHKIRAKLGMGDIKGANNFLGHNYTLEGVVVKGQGIGKKELVATINIESRGYLIPKEGIYATLTKIDDEEHFHPSVSFVGHRVTTDGSFAIETHILDMSDISCQNRAAISFVNFIRDNKKFDSLNELKEAIKSDIAIAKRELKHLSI